MSADADGATVQLRSGAAAGGVAEESRDGGCLAPGRVLRERYVIVKRLGKGGRGSVYQALDRYRASLPAAEQHVALKVLHTGAGTAEQSMQDLARELHCGRALSHRNIVRVFELDRDDEVVFFTMEILDGDLLFSLIEGAKPNPLEPKFAWSLIRQLGEGLQYAHERGIVHGDLKPRNLFVTRGGELRILDFGAAQGASAPPPDGRRLPATYGTPAYASCEQLEGRVADTADDLYAFAVICYQLLAGAHPFAGRPATQARNYGVRANRPVGINGDQWRVLQAGLSWHRSGRSMPVHGWVRRLMRDVPADGAPAAARPRRRLRGGPAAAAAAGVLLAAIGLGGVWHRPAPPPGATTPAAAAPAPSDAAAPDAAAVAAEPGGPAVLAAATPSDVKVAVVPAPVAAGPAIVVEGYRVSGGERFVEVRVRRRQAQSGASFVWWTEGASARQNIDYVQQARAVQTFPEGRRTTRVYVKLLPEAERSGRDFFYLAIAQPSAGNHAGSAVTRAQIWLPTPRAGLRASR